MINCITVPSVNHSYSYSWICSIIRDGDIPEWDINTHIVINDSLFAAMQLLIPGYGIKCDLQSVMAKV